MILGLIAEAHAAGARLAPACSIVGISLRTLERWHRNPGGEDARRGPRHQPSNALSSTEQSQIIAVMMSLQYRGLSPKQLVPQLADEGLYLASESTMYRLQRRHGLRRGKRIIERTHTMRATRMHRATGPNQVWSWDITWLPTTVRGTFLRLYLVMDVWSRRIVGWTISESESSDTAAALIARICSDEGIDPNGLVLHADNGGAMRGRTMLATLQELGIMPSFSRAHVSDDNPYSEALFRTLKYTPAYPRVFENLDEAISWVARFVTWYNDEHRHSAIRYVTPNERHSGREQRILAARHELYTRARASTPARWTRHTRNWSPIGAVTLNPPSAEAAA
jgi:putative transposase